MDCQTVQHHLSAYLDHDVPLITRQGLDEHFARCPQCHCELTHLQTMATWVRSFPTVEPSSTFLQQVCQRVEHLPNTPPTPLFRRLVGAIPLQAAAALVVAVSATLLWQMTSSLWHRQEPQHPAPWVEPWLSQDSTPTPLMAPPAFDPPLEESFHPPAPLVQVSPRPSIFTRYEEPGRLGREVAVMPMVAWSPTEARVSEVSFPASVVLRAADPVQAVQQVWDIVPRMGGVLLQSQGMVTSAGRASRGSVEVTLSVAAERYQALLEALRQLSGTQVIEERMPSASREQRPASRGSLWRLDYAQTSMTPQTTLVITVQPR